MFGEISSAILNNAVWSEETHSKSLIARIDSNLAVANIAPADGLLMEFKRRQGPFTMRV